MQYEVLKLNREDRNTFFLLQATKEHFYKFSPLLMQNIPHEMVNVWIMKKEILEPKRLIPALVQYDHTKNQSQVSIPLQTSLKNFLLLFEMFM